MAQLNPPAHIGKKRWARVLEAFAFGGYVTCAEADAYLPVDEGTTEQACDDGKLNFTSRPFGKKEPRKFVHAWDAEKLLGTRESGKFPTEGGE